MAARLLQDEGPRSHDGKVVGRETRRLFDGLNRGIDPPIFQQKLAQCLVCRCPLRGKADGFAKVWLNRRPISLSPSCHREPEMVISPLWNQLNCGGKAGP